MKPIPPEERCVEEVASEGMMPSRYRRCLNRGTTIHNGKAYCKTHNPALKAGRNKAKHDKWYAKQAEYGRSQRVAEQKRHAEREVIEAAVAWRLGVTGEHCEFEALAAAADHLIALG